MQSKPFPPDVHVSAHGLVGAVFVSIESTDEDAAKGGRLALTLASLRLLPAALERAIAAYDAERRAA